MSGYYKAYKAGKFVVDKIVDAFKPRGMKVPKDIISSVPFSKNLKKKRDIQDSVIKTKDKIMQSLSTEGKLNVRTKVPLKKTNKEISKIYDEKKADGGRIGRKFGGGTDLRDIPAGKKYAGLKKLPKEVRNKMKFKKNGGKI